MTTLHEAAQQALEALEIGYDSAKAEADQYHAAMAGYRPQRHAQMDADVQQIAAAITALRAALAEPVLEPVQEHEDWCASVTQLLLCDPPRKAPCNCKKKVAEPVQEPEGDALTAAYMLGRYDGKRKPLTDAEIADLWHQTAGFHHHFARAIEKAHGIGV